MPSMQSHTKSRRDIQAPPRIETEEEYELAIDRVNELWDSPAGTEDAKTRDILVKCIEEYEERYEDFS